MKKKTDSLVQQAEDFLSRHILSGAVTPGDYLPPEQVLCKKLGIGRSTLRESVGILERKGLVKRRHGVGVQVIDRSQQAAVEMLQLVMTRRKATAADLLEVRRLYEVQAAAWAAKRATREDIHAIRVPLAAMQSKQATPEQLAQADLDFHLAIANAAHNAALRVMVETIRLLLFDAILANLKTDFRPEAIRTYHAKVFEAIRRGSAIQAARAMAEHLDETERMIRRYQKHSK